MKIHSIDASGRTILALAVGALILAGTPARAVDADQPTQNTTMGAMSGPSPETAPTASAPAMQAPSAAPASYHDAGIDARIKKLHDQLKITKDEEAQWSSVAQVMRDNAAAASAAFKERDDKKNSMNAVDDIRSYQAITADRADGLKKLADAFAPLYAAMPEAQQKNADAVFGHKAAKADHRTH